MLANRSCLTASRLFNVCVASTIIYFVLAAPARSQDNELILSWLKLADVPEFAGRGIEKQLKTIFQFRGSLEYFSAKDLPAQIKDPYYWAIGTDAVFASTPHDKWTLLSCNRIGRAALAASSGWPPEQLNLRGVWPVGETIVFPKDALARLDCTILGIGGNAKIDLTALIKDLGALFSNVRHEAKLSFSDHYEEVVAKGGKGDTVKRFETFKINIGQTVNIHFAAWLLTPNS